MSRRCRCCWCCCSLAGGNNILFCRSCYHRHAGFSVRRPRSRFKAILATAVYCFFLLPREMFSLSPSLSNFFVVLPSFSSSSTCLPIWLLLSSFSCTDRPAETVRSTPTDDHSLFPASDAPSSPHRECLIVALVHGPQKRQTSYLAHKLTCPGPYGCESATRTVPVVCPAAAVCLAAY